MKQLLTIGLIASAAMLGACSSMDDGKTYPAPYAHERTAGHGAGHHGADQAFEHKMAK